MKIWMAMVKKVLARQDALGDEADTSITWADWNEQLKDVDGELVLSLVADRTDDVEVVNMAFRVARVMLLAGTTQPHAIRTIILKQNEVWQKDQERLAGLKLKYPAIHSREDALATMVVTKKPDRAGETTFLMTDAAISVYATIPPCKDG